LPYIDQGLRAAPHNAAPFGILNVPEADKSHLPEKPKSRQTSQEAIPLQAHAVTPDDDTMTRITHANITGIPLTAQPPRPHSFVDDRGSEYEYSSRPADANPYQTVEQAMAQGGLMMMMVMVI
jgi:hypothetical protein